MDFTKRGKLIVIEGTDGSGKQTQSERLLERFNELGKKCIVINFPRYETPTGKIVGEACLGKKLGMGSGSVFSDFSKLDPRVASLYYAIDRLAAKPDILKALSENDYVILDRYVESNMGHQCGKLNDEGARRELREWIHKVEYVENKLPRPDAVIFLYMPLKVSRKLKAEMDEELDAHEADVDHLINAENAYLELSNAYNWKKVDCSLNGEDPRLIEEIHKEVYDHISSLN